ncbi:hypothetical protein [Nocardia sp. IFM 10818]
MKNIGRKITRVTEWVLWTTRSAASPRGLAIPVDNEVIVSVVAAFTLHGSSPMRVRAWQDPTPLTPGQRHER